MDHLQFRQHLEEATKGLIDLTQTFCYNDLSDNYKYLLVPNSRTIEKDDDHLNEQEITLLATWNKYEGHYLTADQTVDLIHHDNKVPVWINMTVYYSHLNLTVIELLCSRRLRDEKELMHSKYPPFNLQVAMPPDNLKKESEGKFDVNWKKDRDDKYQSKGVFRRLKRLFY